MRGFLWQHLTDDVIGEFDQFGAGVDDSEISAVSGFTLGTLAGFDMWARHEELRLDRQLPRDVLGRLRERRREVVHARRAELAQGLTPAERMRAVRARRASEGKCVACERSREPGHVRCAEHVRAQREIDSAYRARARKCAAGAVSAA